MATGGGVIGVCFHNIYPRRCHKSNYFYKSSMRLSSSESCWPILQTSATIFASECFALTTVVVRWTILWSSVFSATIIKVAYGVEVAAADDPIIGLMVQTVKGLQGFAPGQFLVHYLPILRFAPLWVPLLGPQLRELARCRAAADKVKQVTFDKTRDDLVGALCHAMHSQ